MDLYLNPILWFAAGAGSLLTAMLVISFNATTRFFRVRMHVLAKNVPEHSYSLYTSFDKSVMHGWHVGVQVGDVIWLPDNDLIKLVKVYEINYVTGSDSAFTARVYPISYKQ